MSALADELLADLDGLSEGGDYSDEEPPAGAGLSNGAAATGTVDVDMSDDEGAAEGEEAAAQGGLVLTGGVKPAEELDAEDVQQMELGAIEDVTSVAKLESGKRMTETLRVGHSALCVILVCSLAA
jgi:U4/U6 small nuclear ribonucleoprotein PRP31